MKLVTFGLEGYKRFVDKTVLRVESRVVALIGPNESGKSSLLQAMLAFQGRQPFKSSEKSRGLSVGTLLSAGYVLDEADRLAIRQFTGSVKVKWWNVTLNDEGKVTFFLSPAPQRDTSDRRRIGAKLLKLRVTTLAEPLGNPFNDGIAKKIDDAIAALSQAEGDLSASDYALIREVPEVIEELIDPDREDDDGTTYEIRLKEDASALVQSLGSYDEGIHPHVLAGRALMKRIPSFILFGDEDRNLRSTYDLEDNQGQFPRALENLAFLANLDLRDLIKSLDTGDRGKRATLLARANRTLAEDFSKSWNQFNVSVHFELDGTELEVLVSLPDQSFTTLEERSTGLLMFVALRAFFGTSGF